ncbi:MAG: phosphatidylserine decarboxylase [bacterium]|nr:phosphatidylserine decarboxylase [bacterium]
MVVTGIYYALGLVAGGLVVGFLTRHAYGIPFYILAAFCLYFFRDPDRKIPPGPVAVAPADGKVVAIKPAGDGRARISIFLNIFDVHVNRSPIAGKITGVEYRKGEFLVASREEASANNEQNEVTVEGDGTTVVFKQIAGLVARRIVFYKNRGDTVEKGERVGLIKFGSRLDIELGPEWEITVKEGQRVQAGSSVVARRRE